MHDERSRRLLETLGLKWEDLPEPVPPTEEEVRQRVGELLLEEKAQAAADKLSAWPELALPALRDAFSNATFLETVRDTEGLHQPLKSVVDILCKSDPQFLVEHMDDLLRLPARYAENCLKAAFEHDPNRLAPLFDRLISAEQENAVQAALLGIRKAAWEHELTAGRSDSLYQSCLRLCSPEYPANDTPDYISQSDPALYVCQSFGSLAQVDLAVPPYFDIDNPHFNEILCWLPSVVAQAAPELVRSEFKRAVEICERDWQSRIVCSRFFPLAALKLGEECRGDIEELLSRDPFVLSQSMRSGLTKALAIITCGRDPLDEAYDADSENKFDSLNKFEQAVMLVCKYDAQVRNGHVFQFLFNSPGIRASETCAALEMIGDTVGLELLQAGTRAVMSEVEANSPHEAVRKLTDHQRSVLKPQLEDLFSKYCAQDEIAQRVYGFVLENSDQFKK